MSSLRLKVLVLEEYKYISSQVRLHILKYIDVGKKRKHVYSCCFKEKSNYFNREKRGIPHFESQTLVVWM